MKQILALVLYEPGGVVGQFSGQGLEALNLPVGNPLANVLSMTIRMYLSNAMSIREQQVDDSADTVKLQDLSIIFMAGSAGQRSAAQTLISPDATRIEIRYERLAQASGKDATGMTPDVVRQAFSEQFHELHHYAFYTAELAESGFALEGEATAYGEISARGASAAGVPSNAKLAKEYLEAVDAVASGAADPKTLAAVDKRVTIAVANAAPTKTECKMLSAALNASHEANGLGLLHLMTLGPLVFRIADAELHTPYAVPWAVYAADYMQQSGRAISLGYPVLNSSEK